MNMLKRKFSNPKKELKNKKELSSEVKVRFTTVPFK